MQNDIYLPKTSNNLYVPEEIQVINSKCQEFLIYKKKTLHKNFHKMNKTEIIEKKYLEICLNKIKRLVNLESFVILTLFYNEDINLNIRSIIDATFIEKYLNFIFNDSAKDRNINIFIGFYVLSFLDFCKIGHNINTKDNYYKNKILIRRSPNGNKNNAKYNKIFNVDKDFLNIIDEYNYNNLFLKNILPFVKIFSKRYQFKDKEIAKIMFFVLHISNNIILFDDYIDIERLKNILNIHGVGTKNNFVKKIIINTINSYFKDYLCDKKNICNLFNQFLREYNVYLMSLKEYNVYLISFITNILWTMYFSYSNFNKKNFIELILNEVFSKILNIVLIDLFRKNLELSSIFDKRKSGNILYIQDFYDHYKIYIINMFNENKFKLTDFEVKMFESSMSVIECVLDKYISTKKKYLSKEEDKSGLIRFLNRMWRLL
ncbi:hypothetical protein DMUE_0508 [Dictyocoela muelleri]|nr:hypothetical protein DMUE_0508 [Dictyocoela muelleri]